MPIYNVAATVVDLIDAPTEYEAVARINRRLEKAGFDLYAGQPTDAFLSDDQTNPEPVKPANPIDVMARADR